MNSTQRQAMSAVASAVLVVGGSGLLWASAPAQAHHRDGHSAPKPSPSASPSPSPSPSASPSPSPSTDPTPSESPTPVLEYASPVDTCGGVFTPGAPAVCTFTYTGGNVQVEGTVLATQVYEYCDDIRCPRSLRGFAYVSLSTADGTQIASCFADAQLLIPGVPGICVGRGSPALPIGTELVCEGFSYSPGTFGCGRAVLP